MKKFFTLICMITCIFGLTACGSEETLTEYEQQKVTYAEQYATQGIVPFLENFMSDDYANMYDENTAEEVESICEQNYNMQVDGNALKKAVESFHKNASAVGSIVSIGETSAVVDDHQIIVTVQLQGEKKNAEAEVILSNDMFMRLESASLNPISGMGEMMGKAALNTLIGMGTVFVVLILISFIISGFGIINKLQNRSKATKKAAAPAPAVAPAPAAPVVETEETDDYELVAVIAAAIAASEGAASTDGFVVRSIRRVGRR